MRPYTIRYTWIWCVPLPRIQRNSVPMCQEIGHGLQECACRRAVDHPMIESQTQHHHRPLGDLTAINHRLLNNPTDTEDTGLRSVEDRREAINPVHAQVRDRKGTAGNFL